MINKELQDIILENREVWVISCNGDKIKCNIRLLDVFDVFRIQGTSAMMAGSLNSLIAKRLIYNSGNIVWKQRLNCGIQLYMDNNDYQELLRIAYANECIKQNSANMIYITEKGKEIYRGVLITMDKATGNSRDRKILISHSSKDKKYCEILIDYLEGIGVPSNCIICTSVVGYGIELNEDIYDWLKNQFGNDLYVIYMLSANYYNSVACLNEMGAAWVLGKEYTSILIPGFDFKNLDGAINPRRIGIKLGTTDDEIRLGLVELQEALKEMNIIDYSENNERIMIRTQSKFLSTLDLLKNNGNL